MNPLRLCNKTPLEEKKTLDSTPKKNSRSMQDWLAWQFMERN